MGVHGLWRLVEPSGKPVPLETLENKVLAVDVSIWLHHIVKGFQDSRGAPVPNAHLLGIYHRVCKLLYFRIKPVFVFDGGVPGLKRETIAKRNQQKTKTLTEADRIHKNLLSVLVKHSAISKVLSEQAKAVIISNSPPKKPKHGEDELYVLPPSQSLDSTLSSSDDDSSSIEDSHPSKHYDLHSIDTEGVQFKSLPVDVRHEILTDLKDTRKQSSWGRIHELPTESDDFSVYQMKRLLKRQSVQTALEEAEKEMGGYCLSLGELEQILQDQGVIGNVKGSRIASDENTRFLLIKDIKQAVVDAKKSSGLATIEEIEEKSEAAETEDKTEEVKNKGEIELQDDLKRAIALSLEETPSTSAVKEVEEEIPSTSKIEEKRKVIGGKGKNRMPLSFLENFQDADFDDSSSEEEEFIPSRLTPAQRYMMEYSGLTPSEIAKIIASKSKPKIVAQKEPEKETIEIMSDPRSGAGSNVEGVIGQEEIIAETRESEICDVSEEAKKTDVATDLELPTTVRNVGSVNVSEQETSVVLSDSEADDDFLDVSEIRDKKSDVEHLEIVIKPNEELEDDLFTDVFLNEDKTQVNEPEAECIIGDVKEIEAEGKDEVVSVILESKIDELETVPKTAAELNTENKIDEIENVPKNIGESNTVEAIESTDAETGEKSDAKSTGLTLKDKIEKMLKNYTKSNENEDDGKSKLTKQKLNEMRENLNKEAAELLTERSTKERLAGNITDQMYKEAQELLELFGVPYLIAPMEAEAQCAFLELIDLTDGTITDDSDIWLFGGKTVYKNFFNQSKTVLEFRSEAIQQHFKLTREQMILLAMLVGSDYTTGLNGVGPVTALEVLAAFPPKNQLVSGLAEFRSWCKKGKQPAPGRTSLRSKLKNVSFTENFPNPRIAEAYLEPAVETSREKFSWGKPDVVGLVEFARQKFGWSQGKTENILNPILRRLEDQRKQKAITEYFRYEVKIDAGQAENKMSKRVKTAINKIGKSNGEAVDLEEEPKPKKKRTGKKKKVDEEVEILKRTQAKSKKRVEEIHKEVQMEVEELKVKKVTVDLHKREVIPQKQKEKTDILKNKLKAIETFRKSKQGPGFVNKRKKTLREPNKDAAYLSEDSSSD